MPFGREKLTEVSRSGGFTGCKKKLKLHECKERGKKSFLTSTDNCAVADGVWCHLSGPITLIFGFLLSGCSVLAEECFPPGPPVFGWGGKAPPDPPFKRSFVTFDRGGQTGPPRSNDFFFGAADDTRAADDRPAGRLAGRPAERPAGWVPFLLL